MLEAKVALHMAEKIRMSRYLAQEGSDILLFY
jgi:hypothetical protein